MADQQAVNTRVFAAKIAVLIMNLMISVGLSVIGLIIFTSDHWHVPHCTRPVDVAGRGGAEERRAGDQE